MRSSSKPLLIFDGDCGFCRTWVAKWKRQTGDRVTYAPYQEVARDFPDIPLERFEASVHLIEEEGEGRKISSGAEAVFRVLSHGGRGVLLWCYRFLPGFKFISECVYRFVANHRGKGSCGVHRK